MPHHGCSQVEERASKREVEPARARWRAIFRPLQRPSLFVLKRREAGGGAQPAASARRRWAHARSPPPRMAQEPRSLVQHLSDQAGLCVTDCARLARVACNDSRVEVRAAARAGLPLVPTTAAPSLAGDFAAAARAGGAPGSHHRHGRGAAISWRRAAQTARSLRALRAARRCASCRRCCPSWSSRSSPRCRGAPLGRSRTCSPLTPPALRRQRSAPPRDTCRDLRPAPRGGTQGSAAERKRTRADVSAVCMHLNKLASACWRD